MNITNDFEPQTISLVQVEGTPGIDLGTVTTSTTTLEGYRYVEPVKTITKPDILITFLKTHPDAILPFKNHPDPRTGDSGYDLFAVETTTIPARGSAVVPVGLKLGFITPGYWFRIEARSGNGFVKSLEPHPGIIDNSYRGDLGIKLFNFSDQDQIIEKGKGVAQFIIYPILSAEIQWTEQVRETERGEKGFGSSDNK